MRRKSEDKSQDLYFIQTSVKQCSICKEIKSLHSFKKNRRGVNGFNSECLECEKTRRRKYYEKILVTNPEYHKSAHRKRLHWKASLKRNYGITPEDYNNMFVLQEGKCAICGIHQSDLNITLHVDHNHFTGEVRGLLCPLCNAGLGAFKDNTELLDSAKKYLSTNKNKYVQR